MNEEQKATLQAQAMFGDGVFVLKQWKPIYSVLRVDKRNRVIRLGDGETARQALKNAQFLKKRKLT